MVFWMQRRKFWTLKRRLLLAEGKPMEPTRAWRKPLRTADIKSGGEFADLRPSELESRWRKRKFRLWYRGLEEPITIEQERRIRWRKRLDKEFAICSEIIRLLEPDDDRAERGGPMSALGEGGKP